MDPSRYDDLDEQEQAAVRATWDEALDAAAGGIDLTEALAEAGTGWSEADVQGRVVIRTATPDSRPGRPPTSTEN